MYHVVHLIHNRFLELWKRANKVSLHKVFINLLGKIRRALHIGRVLNKKLSRINGTFRLKFS